jgi:lysyl-tRNA synthetase class 2
MPTELENQETKIRNRHVDFLVNSKSAQTIHFKSDMVDWVRRFFQRKFFKEVQTPILEAGAGGAVARPFRTSSVEFADRDLNLRIAPELWLKRLIIGGFDRVFEIGSCFRNEGQISET